MDGLYEGYYLDFVGRGSVANDLLSRFSDIAY